MRPVHDAILIEASAAGIRDAVAGAQRAMVEASRAVLGGLEISSSVEIVSWPERYSDPRGAAMWAKVTALLDKYEQMREVG